MAENNYTLNNLQKQRTPLMFTLVKKTMLFGFVMFISSLLAFGALSYVYLDTVAGEQHKIIQQQVGTQVAKLSANNILSHNLIALNMTLQELTESDAILGAVIFDDQDNVLAKAGSFEARNVNKFTIRSDNIVVGRLHINVADLNLATSLTTLYDIVWPVALALGIICLLFSYWYGSRLVAPIRALDDAQNQLLDFQRAPYLDEERLDEWGAINIGFNLIHQKQLMYAQSEHQLAFDDILETSVPTSITSAKLKDYGDIKSLAQELSPDYNDEDDNDPLFQQGQPTGRPRTVPILTMEDLKNNAFDAQNSSTERRVSASDDDSKDDQLQATLENTPPSTELTKHILEMQDAEKLSLMFINFNTIDQGPIDAEAKQYLLDEYQQLVMKVCEIYQGNVHRQPNMDVMVTFDRPEEHMTHCVNALCAAQFFTGLYRAFNEIRLSQQLPTLNVQVVVHTGALSTAEQLEQQAIELGQKLHIDDIIISRQVAYHPDLQKRILEKDNCLLLSNGAFGLSRLSQEYQEQLDKQIDYFADLL